MEENCEIALRSKLPSQLDEDIISYLVSAVEAMSVQERRSAEALHEVIGPFLVDAEVGTEEAVLELCKEISVVFGGSGYKSASLVETGMDDAPKLLSNPVKMAAQLEFVKPNMEFPDLCITADEETILDRAVRAELAATANQSHMYYNADDDGDGEGGGQQQVMTQRQLRKQRRANEQLQKMLRHEAEQRSRMEAEMAAARMAAIKASRQKNGRQANCGVNIDRFSLPHPTGSGDLLTDASLVMMPGRRYGLVGKNGAGKSTLLRHLAHYKLPGLTHLRILLVDQHVEGDEASALQWVLRADVERTALLEEEAKLEAHLHSEAKDLPAELKGVNIQLALQECYERMDIIGVSTAENRAKQLLEGLGFTEASMTKPTNGLSGGWAMRAALASALFVRPNLLLLDEPSNHLDLHALVWLENWLVNYFEGILLVVSHDHVFLNNICTDILELKSTLVGQSKSELNHYHGDYSAYEVILEEHKINQARLRASYEKEKEKLQEFISREGKKYDNPAHQAQRKMKMKQLEKLIEVERVEEDSELVLRFPKPYCSLGEDEILISLKDVGFGWPATTSESLPPESVAARKRVEEMLFEKVNLTIRSKDRVAILGKNGSGKTSLLNIIIGESDPVTGSVRRHLGSRTTLLQQHHYKGEQLEPNLTPLEHLRKLPQTETSAVGLHEMGTRHEETAHRSYLSNFGIAGPRATLPVKYLSGGQRMRVALAVALYNKPDLLILDEPTNHLDAETAKALVEALQSFEGAIIAVSHDEAFVSKVVTSAKIGAAALPGRIFILSGKTLKQFEGTFQSYKKLVLKKVVKGDPLA